MNTTDDGGEEDHEAPVLMGGLAGEEDVGALVGGDRVVHVLAWRVRANEEEQIGE